MQKLISKYGLAAHLAILAVAPLFLFPVFPSSATAQAMLWLSLIGAVWLLGAPSVLSGERLLDARLRVGRQLLRDPVFWLTVALAVFAGLRALNGGIALTYDAEKLVWVIARPTVEMFPGCSGSEGALPFAGSVALVVILAGCRHAMGRAARTSFAMVSSCLAGVAAVLTLAGEFSELTNLLADGEMERSGSAPGLAFALYALLATATLTAVFDRGWAICAPLFFLAIGGCVAGVYAFSPVCQTLAFAGAEAVLVIVAFIYCCLKLRGTSQFKFLVIVVVSIGIAAALVELLMPADALELKARPFATLQFVSEDAGRVRAALSALSLRIWNEHLWIGTGVGSFEVAFRFAARAADWALMPCGAKSAPNGWLRLLVEQGVVGLIAFVVPLAFLTVTFVRRLVGAVKVRALVEPLGWCLPLVLVLVAVAGCFDFSMVRADAVLGACAVSALSAAAFPKKGK